jgi:hypothetical protein
MVETAAAAWFAHEPSRYFCRRSAIVDLRPLPLAGRATPFCGTRGGFGCTTDGGSGSAEALLIIVAWVAIGPRLVLPSA